MALALELALLVLLVLLVARLLPLARYLWRLHLLTHPIPGPRVYPLVGSIPAITCPLEGISERVLHLWQQYGSTFKLWTSHVICAVVVTDPDDLTVVFNSPLLANKASRSYDTFTPMLGRGLINMNGPDYRRHRKAITASLHLEILQDFVTIFQSNALKLANRLAKYAETGEVFNFEPLMADCANLNVCETVLSTDVTGMEEKRASYAHNAHKSSRYMFWRSMRPWYSIDAVFKHLDPMQFEDYYAVAKGMSDYTTEVLARKINQFKRNATPTPRQTKRQTFLEHFLRSEEKFTLERDELLDELKTLMFGASETSVGLLAFFLVSLAENPDIQERVYEELVGVLGVDPARVVEWTDLPHLQYLECVLKEVMRLFPPVPAFGRQATADVLLPSGYTIPEGAYVIICPRLTHRHENHFTDPLRFDPDRFLPENSRGRHPHAYIPFSAGTRSCIGQKYGIMFAKTVAATLMRRYAVLPDPNCTKLLGDDRYFVGITAEIVGGARIRLQKRRAWFNESSRMAAAADKLQKEEEVCTGASVETGDFLLTL